MGNRKKVTLGGGNSPGAVRLRGRQEIDYVIIAPVCGRNTIHTRVRSLCTNNNNNNKFTYDTFYYFSTPVLKTAIAQTDLYVYSYPLPFRCTSDVVSSANSEIIREIAYADITYLEIRSAITRRFISLQRSPSIIVPFSS